MNQRQSLTHRPLTTSEVETLRQQGCSADDWNRVQVTDPFRVARVIDAHFQGDIRLGSLDGSLSAPTGPVKPAGIYHAQLLDCQVGDRVRIAHVGGHVARYRIGDDVLVEGVGRIESQAGAQFGNGLEIDPLNEAGGRPVVLFDGLTAQIAYLMCLYRHDSTFVERLKQMALAATKEIVDDRGLIGDGARVTAVTKIVNVRIGPSAVLDATLSLVNGTILSRTDAPTVVGAGVVAEDFIIAAGAAVTDGAILTRTFVGEACRIGKQFSAEGSLFFANCEAFHGEACSIFAGPYTVTHHKSSLLIGGLFSFFNAGSASNQSNHRYKLGPSHEGKLERGCKTGSSSYLMWPCRVGPFSVVLGKHTRTFDTKDLPFSHVEADPSGKCQLIPGHYIATVGTLRDGRKWPARDRRPEGSGRDLISFSVFNPLTVGRMLNGARRLSELEAATDRTTTAITLDGVEIKRVLLRTGRKRYREHAERYLQERIVARLLQRTQQEDVLPGADPLKAAPEGVYSEQWIDLAGLLLPRQRIDGLIDDVNSGRIVTMSQLGEALIDCARHYADDEWVWVRNQARAVLGVDLDSVDSTTLLTIVNDFATRQTKFLELILLDAEREFDEASRVGYGLDGDAETRRGTLTPSAANSLRIGSYGKFRKRSKLCRLPVTRSANGWAGRGEDCRTCKPTRMRVRRSCNQSHGLVLQRDKRKPRSTIMEDTRERVKRVVGEVLKVDPAQVGDDDRFVEELGAESVQSIELVAAFEEEFDIDLDEVAALKVKNVQDAVDFIARHLDA